MDRLFDKVNYIEDDRVCDYCDQKGIIVSLDDLFDKAVIVICDKCLERLVREMRGYE